MNRTTLRTVIGAGVALAIAGHASAQSANSFLNPSSLSGLSLTQQDPTTFKLAVSASPTITYLGVTYHVNSVFGVWALSGNDSDFAETSDFGDWSDNENFAGTGGIVGWKTNPNDGVGVNQNETFEFDRISLSSVSGFGYHLRVSEPLPGGGNTAYFRSIPAPGSAALFGLTAFAVGRRRFR